MNKLPLNQLEKNLKSLKNDNFFNISKQKKESIKNNIFQTIDKEQSLFSEVLIPFIKNLKASIKAPNSLKERILGTLFPPIIRLNPFSSIFNLFSHHKKSWATFTIIIFIFSITFTFTVNPTPTYAIKKTVLEIQKGQVQINRDGIILSAKTMELLSEGDIVMTQSDSKATIYFPDDSLSRLDSQSEVKIEQVNLNLQNPANSTIEININKGRVWNNVANLDNEQGVFTVSTPQSTAKVTSKATFDIEVNDEGVNINTIQNNINITVKQTNNDYTVQEGQQATIKKGDKQITKNTNNPENKKWVDENLADDTIYIAKLEGEKAKELLAKADNENETLSKLEKAEKQFMQAEILIAEGKMEEATNLLNNYKTELAKIAEEARILKNEDPETGESIILAIKVKLDNYQNSIGLLPQSSLAAADSSSETIPEIIANSEEENILETAILDQKAATPNASTQKTHKAILDLYFESQNLKELD